MMILLVLLLLLCIAVILFMYGRIRVSWAEKRYPPGGDYVMAEGIRLHYISEGEGRAIVFLHGGILDGSDFREAIKVAASRGLRGIAFDRPGYGYSDRPRKTNVTPAVQARLLHRALQELEVEKPVLVGHSWSGVLVMEYALRYPEEISGIVTLGGGMYPEGYPAEKGDPISSIVTAPVLGWILTNAILPVLGPPLADRMLKETFKPEPVPESYRKAAKALWLRPGQFKANREDVLAFVPAAKAVSGQYGKIGVPVAIVVGDRDPFETKSHSYRLHEEIPESKLIVLEHAAHMIPQHHPEAVMDAVAAFIKKT